MLETRHFTVEQVCKIFRVSASACQFLAKHSVPAHLQVRVFALERDKRTLIEALHGRAG